MILALYSLFNLGLLFYPVLVKKYLIKRPWTVSHGVRYVDLEFEVNYYPEDGQPTKKYVAHVIFRTADKEKLRAVLTEGYPRYVLLVFMDRAIIFGHKYQGVLQADGSIVLVLASLPSFESIEDDELRSLFWPFFDAYQNGLGDLGIIPTMVIFYPFKT